MITHDEFNLMLAKKNEAQNISDVFFDGRYLIHIIDTRPTYKGDFLIFADSIINVICRYFNLNVDNFKNRGRKMEYCDARNMYAAYIKETYEDQITLTAIGRTINRDHATIIHYLKKHKGLMETDPLYQSKYLGICNVLSKTSKLD